MSDRRNGLYYESVDIRNSVLSRNIGKYSGYRQSLLFNGGLAIGMPYAVETELRPIPLSDRAIEGIHLNTIIRKEGNPKINMAWREGGLFGYTHEVINPYYDWIYRNQNIIETYYDYDSTEDIISKLNMFPSALPWGLSGDGPNTINGLRPYSSVDEPQNSEYFTDYTVYARNIFTDGLSFDKSLGERYQDRLLHIGFNEEGEDAIGNIGRFIEDRSGYITDDIDELKRIGDTRLGYIGRILLGENKIRRVYSENDSSVSNYEELTDRPGINGQYSALWGAGVSYVTSDTGKVPEGERYIREVPDVVESIEEDEYSTILGDAIVLTKEAQHTFMKRSLRRNRYKNIIGSSEYVENQTYASYANVSEFGSVSYFDEDESGENYTYNENVVTKDLLGDSVDGFFASTGPYDGNIKPSDHYDEQDGMNGGERDVLSRKISYNGTERLGTEATNGFSSSSKSLLEKTKNLFARHKIKTLVGRFHTSSDDKNAKQVSITQSATNETYGISHGRNLLKLRETFENGYSNPYCRVWTYHHQYMKMTDRIRPFVTENGYFSPVEELQANYPGRPILSNPAGGSWSDKTVLNKTGFVNVAPTKKIGQDTLKAIKAKQCMLSIENLAWKGIKKDESTIDRGEIGPLGGRIMWFPPYNLTFNESVSVSWGSNDFIGRGERIYSYTNTERTGTLTFTILADHPSILNYWRREKYDGDGPGDEEGDQDVLRFFAGCGEIDAPETVKKGQKNKPQSQTALVNGENQNNTPQTDGDRTSTIPEDNTNEELTTTPPSEFTKENSIGFYVYFPNNLSCIDFVKNPKAGVNYLVHGKNGFEFNPDMKGDEDYSTDKNGDGYSVLDTVIATVGKWAEDILMDTPTGGPGYEMKGGGEGHLTDEDTAEKVKEHNKKKANDDGRNYIWGYGVDQDKVKERLCGPHGAKGDKTYKLYPENYCDSTNYGLNSSANGYKNDDACDYSFMDVAAAITTDYKYEGKGFGEVPKKVAKIKEILGLVKPDDKVNNQGGRKYYFSIAGGASVHGYVDRNTGLSQRRASFLRAWLEDCFKKLNLQVDYDENAKIPTKTGIEGGEESLDINSESAKRGRYAKAVIYWNDEDIKDSSEAETEYVCGDTTDNTTIKEQAVKVDSENSEVTNEQAAESPSLNSTVVSSFSSVRYRDEEEFFSMVKESDPLIYKLITDKVKYFDPTYHSITPEGFNARLSFLQQCTRQGPTMSSSDLTQNNGINGVGYAGNLSFGRAPVCVLRLGDFFNTRIIINSLNIQYETGQWDLNPEGIGVQPMLANVTIGFVFQGGSSLGGPIQRLQNAVSFNYYANQEVYDDRADSAVYNAVDEGGDGELSDETYVWVPGYGKTDFGSLTKMMDQLSSTKKEDVKPAEKKDEGVIGTTKENIVEQEVEKAHQEQEQEAIQAAIVIADAPKREPLKLPGVTPMTQETILQRNN